MCVAVKVTACCSSLNYSIGLGIATVKTFTIYRMTLTASSSSSSSSSFYFIHVIIQSEQLTSRRHPDSESSVPSSSDSDSWMLVSNWSGSFLTGGWPSVSPCTTANERLLHSVPVPAIFSLRRLIRKLFTAASSYCSHSAGDQARWFARITRRLAMVSCLRHKQWSDNMAIRKLNVDSTVVS